MSVAFDDPVLLATVLAFGGLLLFAAVSDAARFEIPNTVSVAILAVFITAVIASPLEFRWIDQLGAFALVLGAGWALFAFGFVGGGDVKLMAAIAPWCGLTALPTELAYVALSGGVLALVLLGLRSVLPKAMAAVQPAKTVQLPRVLRPGEPMPYGIAIAFGTILAIQKFPLLAPVA